MSEPPQPKVLRPREAAAFLHISDRTLRDWDRRGLIPSHDLGGLKFYLEHEILASMKGTAPELDQYWQRIERLIDQAVDRRQARRTPA